MSTTLDLYLSKSEQLAEWIEHKVFFSTADIMRYATDNYYLRAKRTINDFVKEGKVRIVPPAECSFRGLRGKMRWYEYLKK